MHNILILPAKAQTFYHPNHRKLGPRDHLPDAGLYWCYDQLSKMAMRYAHRGLLTAMPMICLLIVCQYHGHQRSDECHDTSEYLGGPINDHETPNI